MVFFELFANNPDIVRVAAGQPLFSEGDEGHRLFVLTTGQAEIIVNNRVVETIQHGNIVGEMGLVSPGPRSATVVALSDCEFVAVDERRFQYLVQQTPFLPCRSCACWLSACVPPISYCCQSRIFDRCAPAEIRRTRHAH